MSLIRQISAGLRDTNQFKKDYKLAMKRRLENRERHPYRVPFPVYLCPCAGPAPFPARRQAWNIPETNIDKFPQDLDDFLTLLLYNNEKS